VISRFEDKFSKFQIAAQQREHIGIVRMPPPDKRLKFVEGERVLCFHGPLIYEAVIKGQMRDKVTKYLIHYNGWNKNWDEWVTESRVMKFCEENLKKQRELKQQYATSKRAKKEGLGRSAFKVTR